MTLRMYAERKGWALTALEVALRYDVDDNGQASIDPTITMSAELPQEQRGRLAEIADRTPVTLAVRGGTPITTTLEPADPTEAHRTGRLAMPSPPSGWPALPYDIRHATCDTLRTHTQVLGKVAAALAPPNLSCNTRPSGSASADGRPCRFRHPTAPAPSSPPSTCAGTMPSSSTPTATRRVPLGPDRPVAHVTRDVLEAVNELAGSVQIDPDATGNPVDDATRRGLRPRHLQPRARGRLLRRPRRTLRSCSLHCGPRIAGAPARSTRGGARSTSQSACTPARPSTRRRTTSSCATRPLRNRSKLAGGPVMPATPDPRSRVRLSRSRQVRPATLSPATTRWDTELGEYLLDWDDALRTPDPHRAAVEFGLSAIRHACIVCSWDPTLAPARRASHIRSPSAWNPLAAQRATHRARSVPPAMVRGY